MTSDDINKESQQKNSPVSIPIGIIAIFIAGFCLFLSFFSTKAGIIYIQTSGNPSTVVDSFYSSIINNDYESAYLLLNDCKSLGLETEISDMDSTNKLISDALRYSYNYSLSGNTVINGLTATQTVIFSHLDVNAVKEEAASHIDEIIEKKIETLSREELYSSDGHYQKDLMEKVYNEAVNAALKYVDKYYVTDSYDVTLTYKEGDWYINTNDEMLEGFAGGQQ